MGISSGTVSVPQGSVSVPVVFSITAKNGFNGQVQIALAGLPAGVVSNPPSPFMAAPGADTQVVFGAAGNAATGNFAVSAQGTSGGLAHTTSLTLAIQGAVIGADFPRSTFVRTDSAPSADNPPGEAHHRHLAYDLAHQHLFVANRAMNRLEVISTIDQSIAAQIAIAGVTSADLSADGETVWAGTAVNEIVAVDSTSLLVTRRYPQAEISPAPSTIFDPPVEILSLSNGKCLLRLRQPTSSEALLALWDPRSNALTNLTSMAPSVFQNGLGPMARTGDRAKAIVAANDSSGILAVIAPNGGLVAGPKSLGGGSIGMVAANSDGSRFAAIFSSGGVTQVLLLDGSLNQVAARPSSGNRSVTFSRDGNFIFLSESAMGGSAITALDGHDLHVIGQVPGAAIQGVGEQIEDADETQLLFGVSNRGVSFIDAASPVTLSAAAPSFAAAPVSIPSEGPNAGGTALLLSGQNLAADSLLKIGTLAVGDVSVLGPTAIQATSPASIANGPVGVTAYSPSNHWLAIAPGLAMHPTGALLYQPFLTGPAGAANTRGGVDITDARSGVLRMRIISPQQFMTDVDTLHGGFLTIDENGQRLFAITTLDGTPQKASLTIVQLAAVPLAIGSLSSSTVPVAGGASITIRGSGLQSGIKATIGGKSTAATFVDMNTITVTSPALPAGAQQIVLTNTSGETVSLDAALTAN